MIHVKEKLSDAVNKGWKVVPDLLLKIEDDGRTVRLLHEATFSYVLCKSKKLDILAVD